MFWIFLNEDPLNICFQCTVCDKSFRLPILLRRHANLYHTPNYVPSAPKVFAKIQFLKPRFRRYQKRFYSLFTFLEFLRIKKYLRFINYLK